MTHLILHAAHLDGNLPASSLAALELSLQAGISRIEVDIFPLKDGDFALLHDPDLGGFSEKSGSAVEKTAEQIQNLRYKNSPHKLGTLSQAVALLQKYPVKDFLQLDLKPYAPLTLGSLQKLLQWIMPIQEKILVSSVADWAIRLLHQLSPALKLGFDPLLYLDLVAAEPREEGVPPFRVGAFGYLDDHPLAVQRWGSLKDYFAARAEALLQQVPRGITWFINAHLLEDSLQAGFNWINFLHSNENTVDAWTLDLNHKELAQKMVQTGVDFITTNDIQPLREFLFEN